MAVTIDIKDGARISRTKNGYRADRIAIVSGVTGSASARLYNAITDSGLPAYGSAHPSISTIYLNDITGDVIDPDTVKLTLSYYDDPTNADGGETTSRASGTTTIEEVKLDINGDAMVTQYTGASIPIISGETFTAEVERPRVTFDFEFTSSTFPKSTIDTYLGKINSVIWNGYPVKTILCTAVNTDKQGDDYKIRISFAYNPDTWVFLAKTSYYPPLLDHPSNVDSSLDLATGTRPWDVYSTADFSPLALTL